MSLKVLLVDSDWYFLNQATNILESRGHHVLQEPDPAEAVERARRWRPDVAMVDVRLPVVHQGELLAQLADIQPRPAIVLLSALGDFEKAWKAWQRGGDDVLFKPILHPADVHLAILTARKNALCPQRRPTIAQPQPVARSA